jgi:murein peptide amidase A
MIVIFKKPPKLVFPNPASALARLFGNPLVAKIKSRLTPRTTLIGGSVVGALLIATYTVAFFWPRSVMFSYAGNACLTQPVILPALTSKTKSTTYVATPNATLSIAGYPLYSQVTCISPTASPREHTTETINFGSMLSKRIHVSADTFPALKQPSILDRAVPVQDPLELELNQVDRIFDYQLSAGDKKVACSMKEKQLSCDISKMNLKQSTKYDFALERQFNGSSAGMLFVRKLTTVKSVRITGGSIKPGQVIYTAPKELKLTLNRPSVAAEDIHLSLLKGNERQDIGITASVKDKTLSVRFEKPLVREASFLLTVGNVKTEDGGFLPSPYSLKFQTSGGPKVLGVNIGTYKVDIHSSVVVAFDSAVSTKQSLNSVIRLEAGGKSVTATISTQGNNVVINPKAALPRCASLTIRVMDGLQNRHGITGGTAWQYNSRTICQEIFSIGASVLGRGIIAYKFGSGAKKIIFVGGTHGDERSSVYLLNGWVDYLEANAHRIPAGISVVVIPNVNPDGYALSRRTNARNVDLNRNFPAHDWKKSVTMPGGSVNPNGGGSAPLSEPESRALASYILGQSPSLVLTYHATGGVVVPNDSGDSRSRGQAYDQRSNVYYLNNGATGTFFPYDTTGSFEAWLHDKHAIPALLIELWTETGYEFGSHVNAMWSMIQ